MSDYPGSGDVKPNMHLIDKEFDEYVDSFLEGSDEIEPRIELPSMNLHMISYNWKTRQYETNIIESKSYYENKRVIFLGIIGAFVPECTCEVIFDWARASEVFKDEFVIDEITVVTQNDPFVVNHFAKRLGYKDRINFIADWNGQLNEHMKCEKELELELGKRNHRYASFIPYNTLQIVLSSAWEDMFYTKIVHPMYMWNAMKDPNQKALFFC